MAGRLDITFVPPTEDLAAADRWRCYVNGTSIGDFPLTQAMTQVNVPANFGDEYRVRTHLLRGSNPIEEGPASPETVVVSDFLPALDQPGAPIVSLVMLSGGGGSSGGGAGGGGGGDNATRISNMMNGRTANFAYVEPSDPVTSSTIDVVSGSFASLQSAVSTAGALVNVPAGVYTGNLDFDASDVDVVMSSGATVVGNVTFGTGPTGAAGRTERVRWTGGNQSGGFLTLNHFRDLMVDGVQFTTSGGSGLNQMSGGSNGTDDGWQRVAFLNSFIDHQSTDGAGDWAWYTEGYSGATQSDLFLMNVRMLTDGGQCNRFQSITRFVCVDSSFNDDFGAANGFRTGPGGNGPCTDLYFDNVVVCEGWLMNYTGAQNVLRGEFNRVNRYHDGSFFNFADMVGSNTGTISNSGGYGSSGTPPGSLSVSPFTDGGGNTTGNHSFLVSGVDALPDGTPISTVGQA